VFLEQEVSLWRLNLAIHATHDTFVALRLFTNKSQSKSTLLRLHLIVRHEKAEVIPVTPCNRIEYSLFPQKYGSEDTIGLGPLSGWWLGAVGVPEINNPINEASYNNGTAMLHWPGRI
jgi:hypothetical protein